VRCFGAPDEVSPETKYIDNLTDRIAGRRWRIRARNLTRRLIGQTRKQWMRPRYS
jgi:hypothetical protein